jgi:hypothetical protein
MSGRERSTRERATGILIVVLVEVLDVLRDLSRDLSDAGFVMGGARANSFAAIFPRRLAVRQLAEPECSLVAVEVEHGIYGATLARTKRSVSP